LIVAMMVNTSQPIQTTTASGQAMITPRPKVTMVSSNSTNRMMATVMLKFSASLPWSSTKGMVSFFTSQMISGPMKQPQPNHTLVSTAPASADKCANIAH
jgi:hypothetical protein